MSRVPLMALACAAVSCAAHSTPPPPAAAEEEIPSLQLPDGVRPLRYAIDLEVVPSRAGFRGRAAIDVELATERTSLWMHGRDLRVSRAGVSVGRDELPASYVQVSADGVVRVAFPRPLGPGRATLRFEWEAGWNQELVGLYLARGGGETYAATQLEAAEARRVFPAFDEPRFKTPFDVSLTVPTGAVAVSNTAPTGEEPAGEGLRRVRFATTEPLPTYLLFAAVGPFDVVEPPPLPPNELRATPLAVRGLAPKGHGAELAFALEASAAFVPWFERYFATAFPYPKLDHVALPEFAWGAMENAGAIAYRDAYLLAPAGTPEEARREISVIVAHEISHHWFGDLVTLPWWTDAWLNEAFATWIGDRAAGRWRPDWNLDLESLRRAEAVMAADSLAASRAVRQPLAAMAEVDNQFDGMSYEKGGAVLASFERLLGEERFRDGVREYLAARRHGTGSAPELYAALSRSGGRELAPALSTFTDRAGVPLVAARVVCEPGAARLALAQSRWVPRGSGAGSAAPWRVPFCARWEAAGRVEEGCTLLESSAGVLPLGATCPGWVMPHAAGLSYHRWTMPAEDLARLRAAGLPRLSAAEKISLARNLRAAQQAGAVPWAEAMELIAALADDPDPEVALEPVAVLSLAHDRLVPPEARPAVAAFVRERYRPVLERVGWDARPGEGAATKRLRAGVIELLAFAGADADVRREAARRGAAFGGLDGPPRADAVDADLAEVALAAAVQHGGARAFDAVVARLATTDDASLRPRLVRALCAGDDPLLARRAAALWRRSEVRAHERDGAVWSLGRRSAGREALLAELERDGDALLEALPGPSRTFLPLRVAGACDTRSAERLRASLEPLLAKHPQMRRALAQSLERIRVCAAEREAEGATAAAFFARGAAAR